jgi:peptidoglycan-N-acetylglucosamine deacetylase
MSGRSLGVACVLVWAQTAGAFAEPSTDSDAGARAAQRPTEASLFASGVKIVLPEWAEVDMAPRERLPAVPIYHGGRDSKRVALTFDACSTHDSVRFDPRILDILLATGTPATMFMGGHWMVQEPDRVRELADYPQLELALHGYFHPRMTRFTDRHIQDELIAAERVLFALTGRRTPYYRPPFGDIDERVVQAAADAGYATVMYDVASGDPDPRATAPKLVAWLERLVQGGSVVVMHINMRGHHTASALEDVIATLQAKGFVFVTMSELLQVDEASEPLVQVGSDDSDVLAHD